jgi:hypothetical protein
MRGDDLRFVVFCFGKAARVRQLETRRCLSGARSRERRAVNQIVSRGRNYAASMTVAA